MPSVSEGRACSRHLGAALDGPCAAVRGVRGQGILVGVSYVDPADGTSLLDPALQGSGCASDNGSITSEVLLVYLTQPTYVSSWPETQTVLAPGVRRNRPRPRGVGGTTSRPRSRRSKRQAKAQMVGAAR